MRSNNKGDVPVLQAFRQDMPRLPFQDDTKVANGNLIPVDGIGRACVSNTLCEVSSNLVIEKIKVDPPIALTPDTATQQVDIKPPCGLKITHRES